MEYSARSPDCDGNNAQTYLEHIFHVLIRSRCYLRKVLHYAKNFDSVTIRHILELAAEYHDLGKLNDENQEVLSGKKKAGHLPVAHADAGVAYLDSLKEKAELAAFFASLLVFSHHKGLPDFGEINVRGMRNTDIEQEVDQELPILLKRHENSVRSSIFAKSLPGNVSTLQPADVRVLFSCLTHADHGDAARASNDEPHHVHVPKLRARERLDALRCYVDGLSGECEKSERNQMRSAFFEACSTGMDESAITICDAPVGTGKTTAVISNLLNIAAERGLRRIFVILPFTNIITQSVKTYRNALTLPSENPEDVVAEIHHRADFKDRASRKLTALWDAPIVVTTAVAFFETLASARSSTLRRLQNLPGSAVFLDEAHAMLPVKLLPLAWRWIQHAASEWSCHWVLASGSLYHFWTLEEFGDADPQLPNILPSEQQDKLQDFEVARICHRFNPEPLNLEQLVSWLKELDGPVIVVVNTVHTAAAAAQAAVKKFGEDNVLHLSTSLTPMDRAVTLDNVKKRLKDKSDTQWYLFATSCVEAGVDLSFRTGVRECASLLSLLQFAGRVNRNSEDAEADVWTVTLNANDSGVTQNPSLRISARILREFFNQECNISPELCTAAMRQEMRETSSFSTKLNDEENKYAFRTVDKEFKVIEDESQLAVVDFGLVHRIQDFHDVSWREIQAGSVRIRRNIREKLYIEESKRYPGVWLWPEGAKYSSFLGYMEAVLELKDFDRNGGAII